MKLVSIIGTAHGIAYPFALAQNHQTVLKGTGAGELAVSLVGSIQTS
jgi:hypothetical protein